MSADKSKIVSALKALQNSYLRAENLMIKPEGAIPLKEFLPTLELEFKAVMDLCDEMSDSDTLPETVCRKADCRWEKEEFDERVQQWFATLEKGKSPMPEPSHNVPDDRLSIRSSRNSTTSSIRSEIRRSRVKVKIARLAHDQEVANQRRASEEAERLRRDAEDKARRIREAARRAAEEEIAKVQRAAEEAQRAAEEEVAKMKMEADRIEENARRNAQDRRCQLQLAEVEAQAWEEESTCESLQNSQLHLMNSGSTQRPIPVTEDKQYTAASPHIFSKLPHDNKHSLERDKPFVGFPKPSHEQPSQFVRELALPRPVDHDYPEVGERFLPRPVVKKFDGDPMNYWSFVRQFDVYIAKKSRSDDMRLLFLQQHCEPHICEKLERFNAKDPSEGYKLAWQTLHEEYGQPHVIAQRCEQHLKASPVVETHDPDGLMKLSVLLDKCCTALHDIRYASSVDSMEIMLTVARKLPVPLRDEWIARATDIEKKTGRRADFAALTEFIGEKSQQANSIFGKALFPPKEASKAANRHTKVTAHNTVASEPSPSVRCVLCAYPHEVYDCPAFKEKTYLERRRFVRTKGLCFRCLKGDHIASDCNATSTCKVEGCTGTSHHHLLHDPAFRAKPHFIDNGNPTCTAIQTQEYTASVNAASVYLNVVPVVVRHGNTAIATYAFLDQGSTTTFCERKLMDKLGACGKPKQILLNTLTTPRHLNTVAISVAVEPLGGGEAIDLPEVVVVNKIPVMPNVVPDTRTLRAHRSLQDLTLCNVPGGSVTLLIGANIPVAHRVKSVRPGDDCCPDAVRTPLGWSLLGQTFESQNPSARVHFASAVENAHAMFLSDEGDFLPTDGEDGDVLGHPFSTEDRRTYRMMKDSVKFVDGHYELPLPWRHDHQIMPDNLKMATNRLGCLRRRLARDDVMMSKYGEQMQTTIDKGYAEEISTEELSTNQRVWYIPHHGVLNPNKPGKLRVVFDCAAQYRGLSLNQALMQGPDFVNSLVGVLLRFRKEPIALVADIEAMFYQVRVAPRDRDCLRFLWWAGGDLSKAPTPHRMKVHLFGAASSPSCAAFCLRQAASDFGSEFEPLVASTVERNFYVDDCLTSVSDVNTGLELVAGLRSLLAKGGFRLTKWLSNSKEILDSLPTEELSKSLLTHPLDADLQERVLGVHWSVQADKFNFTVSLPVKPRTRRGLLSTMNSLFDPLGFVVPVVVEARLIYRSLCQQEIEWDEEMPPKDLQKWERWLFRLSSLRDISIPRSFNLHAYDNIQGSRLHVFSDASKEAYGAVCYLRSTRKDSVTCTLVMSKSRLAPQGEVSIPRLELMAAVTAVKMEQTIKGELGLDLRPSIFWTDSSVVLQSIHNDRRRFPLFVSRRLAFIEKNTCTRNWKHVPTKQNPADLASRGAPADTLAKSNMWFFGPTFLKDEPAKWPNMFEKQDVEVNANVFEKKPADVFTVVESACPMDRLLMRFSSLYKLKSAVAWMLRFKSHLLQRVRRQPQPVSNTPLTVHELKLAEMELVKYVQRCHFAQWMFGMSGEGRLKKMTKSSPIFRLDPFLVEGVLRVGGRLEKAPVSYEARHPAILPHNSCLTNLIITDFHQRVGHSGLNHTLTTLNQRFWIVGGAVAVRRALSRCLKCRRRDAKPAKQLMSELPPARLQMNVHPFAYTGVDYFGPLLIKRGRSEVKRYGCLFTCLTTRAVHLEVACDLSTDAFVNALRRFIARRGVVLHMYSDNGTNLVGAERVLKDGIRNWNQQQIEEHLKQKEIQWTFNPPSASHMGGAWERMIRSARRILSALTNERTLTDDQLQTLLSEVESILNSRPLTPVTWDVDDETPLTPNHLLRVNPFGGLPPAATNDRDCYARQGWRHVQYLSDQFWKRWSREYLRTIISRQKWHDEKKNLQVNDVVLLVDNASPRSSWSIGRIVAVHPDEHGVVRNVMVRSKGNCVRRPIHKLCLIVPADEKVYVQAHDDPVAVASPANEL
uniref:Uncharacterized protein LOC104265735 n=1 Tax=Phallusia mammillata TaxID=59560 RepID=A0A6F9DJL0_9ASCI|nr:uncharacterized protein LOC104265735 [Phallusia mammillata]